MKIKPEGSVDHQGVCANCGGTTFIWGGLMGGIRFVESDLYTSPIGRAVQGRVCDQCGHLQLFTSRPYQPKAKKRG